LWIFIIGLLLLGISAQLIATADVALNYWYLMSVPLVVAAFHFGFRGAAAVAVVTVAVLLGVSFVASQFVLQVSGAIERLIVSSTSPDEILGLAMQLGNLRSADPQTSALRALTGLLLVIASSLLMGAAVDGRRRTTGLLEQALQLRRYFSPQLVQAITSSDSSFSSARKEITVIFVDLRNFTALAERLAPEELTGVLNDYLTAMTEEIVNNDGTLDKYIGDAVMAFFGDPIWTPDHADRAFRAAIAMQQRMSDLQSRWQAQGRDGTGAGIGVATGHATVGNFGSPMLMGYTAVGSVVNVAARLCELAAAGQVLTTAKTYWRVQSTVEGAPREPTAVKGFPYPVEIVEVLGSRAVVRTPGTPVSEQLVGVVSRIVTDPVYRASLLAAGPDGVSITSLTKDENTLAQQVAVLCGYPIFQRVPAMEIALLMEAASLETYAPGTVVVRQGAVEDKFYLILKGDVAVTALDELNRQFHVASLARGDHFGEVALLFDTPRNATIRTTSESQLAVLRRDKFYEVLGEAPSLKDRIEGAARRRAGADLVAVWPEVPAAAIPAGG
jgi:class 3 adenylate cyclase